MAELVTHPLAPIFDAHSRVLILGTMPSPASRAAAFYYAHPQNRFWRVLCAVLGEQVPTDNAGKTALVLRRGIALWDTLAACEITGAADSAIKNPQPSDLAPIFETGDIQKVFVTGQKAAQLYRRYQQPRFGVEAAVLPSPSPANCAVGFAALCAAYAEILPYLNNGE